MKNLLLFCLFCILLVSCDGKPKSDFKGGDETELNKKITKFIESNDYNEIEIMEYRSFIDKNERSCYLTEQVLFHGDPRNLPEELHYYFSSPINHLLVKASCYKCTHSHYSLRD